MFPHFAPNGLGSWRSTAHPADRQTVGKYECSEGAGHWETGGYGRDGFMADTANYFEKSVV